MSFAIFYFSFVAVICFIILLSPYILNYRKYWIRIGRNQQVRLVLLDRMSQEPRIYQGRVVRSRPLRLTLRQGGTTIHLDPRSILEVTIIDGEEEFFSPELPLEERDRLMPPEPVHASQSVHVYTFRKQKTDDSNRPLRPFELPSFASMYYMWE